ncbi:MAG: DNA alkylation repair protein [Deferribacteres bacterium]|nr:DNA alkylation repair protein [candidate division KSB1 bacterium]MCB9512321.1 DNA alkylation repair protein [Deferribacteres bacterium]
MRQFTVEEVERAFLMRKDEAHAKDLQALVRTNLNLIGLSRQDFIDILRDLEPHLPDIEEEFIWLNFLQDLWENSYFEARLFALELMFAKSELIDAHLWGMLDHWSNGVDNWVLSDWLGHLRAIAIRKADSLITRMTPWLTSSDPWRRRSTIVSLLYIDPETLQQELLIEPHEVFAFIEPAIEDENQAVRMALAWLFRQIQQRSPETLIGYLRKNKDRISPDIIKALQKPKSQTKQSFNVLTQ